MSTSLFVLATLLTTTSSPAAPKDKPKLVVLDIQTSGVAPSHAPMLTEMLTSEIAALGHYEVIAGADIATVVNLEQQRQMLGCENDSCLAEVGGALGARKLVVGQIAHIGETYVINLKLVDTAEVRTEQRFSESIRGDIDEALVGLKRLAHKLVPEGAGSATGSGASAPPTIAADDEGLHSPGAAEWIAWGMGAAAIGAGVYFGLRASTLEEHVNDPSYVGAQKEVDQAARAQLIANASYGVGAASVVFGLAWWLLRPRSSPPPVVLAPSLGGKGMSLTTSVSF